MTGSNDSGKPQKPRKRWYVKSKNIIAILTTSISVIAATAAILQVNQARDQNVAAEQEELLTIVGNLAEVPSILNQESVTFKSDPAALQNAQNGTDNTQLADSEEAVNLISLLNDDGVTAEEYLQVAMGLQNNGIYAQALSYLGIAASQNSSPRINADIWRDYAQIYYQLNRASVAEHYIRRAYNAFNVPGEPKGSKLGNMVYTELFDAVYQASINCSIAREEVSFANGLTSSNPSLKSPSVVAQETRANEALARCPKPRRG
jgi:tetratricopeptide (TPR) repeat protein